MKEDASGKVRVKGKIKELYDAGMLDKLECNHFRNIKDVIPSANGCEECLRTGDTWVHLRVCLECGHVGCCDDSKNKHATRHYHQTHHPVIASYEEEEGWIFCYPDNVGINLE